MSGKFSLDDYVDVAERIQNFTAKYPDGSLQTIDWCVSEIGSATFIVYRAAAYRTPDDPRPGHGIAWEPFPGQTPYTKNSELMNAETAAWGRAIVALGLTANRKIASRQEVRARSEEAAAPKPAVPDDTPIQAKGVEQLQIAFDNYVAAGLPEDRLQLKLSSVGAAFSNDDYNAGFSALTRGQGVAVYKFMLAELEAHDATVKISASSVKS